MKSNNFFFFFSFSRFTSFLRTCFTSLPEESFSSTTFDLFLFLALRRLHMLVSFCPRALYRIASALPLAWTRSGQRKGLEAQRDTSNLRTARSRPVAQSTNSSCEPRILLFIPSLQGPVGIFFFTLVPIFVTIVEIAFGPILNQCVRLAVERRQSSRRSSREKSPLVFFAQAPRSEPGRDPVALDQQAGRTERPVPPVAFCSRRG